MPLFSEKPGKGLLGETFLFSKSIGDVFCATFSLVRKSNQKRRFTFFLLLQKEPKSSREGCDPPDSRGAVQNPCGGIIGEI